MKNGSEPKVCGSCGESFGCGAGLESCWCSNLTVPARAASELAARFEDCLCPGCLEKWSEEGRAPV